MVFDVKNVLFIVALIALCFLAVPVKVSQPNLEQKLELFSSFQARYKKSYSKDEHDVRFKNFERSLEIIEELNKNRPSPESARYGITEFSDLSEEEFKSRHLRHSVNKHVLVSHRHNHDHHHNHVKKRSITIPTSIPPKKDWREAGIIGKVRNQQTCGACWAFSTVETAESMFALKNGTLNLLSVQEVIDCAGNGNMGCSGGDFCALLDWIDVNKVVLEPESDYPLLLKDAACKRKTAPSTNGVKIKSYTCDTLVPSESSILTDIANHGPVIAAVNALTWQYYLGGVIQNCDGSLANINHAVQIVGYDGTAPIPHYIIRNSWGTGFGDSGYIYLAIGSNVCGIRTELSTLDVE